MTDQESKFFRLSVRPWGLVTAAGVLACVATLLGFLGRFAWFLDLFAHFRVQYLISLALLGTILLAARRRRTAVAFFAMACVNLALVLPLYFGGSSPHATSATELRAMLLNVNTRLGDPQRVEQVVRAVDPDLVVLEEISARWMTSLAGLAETHPHRVAWPREDNFGIALFSKFPVLESDVVFLGSGEVPTIVATIDTPGTPLRVIATHPLPPVNTEYARARDEQIALLADYARSPHPRMLLGDLNATPWSHHFRKLLSRSGLQDSMRGFGVQPTWPNYSRLLRIPIDHCLHSSNIAITDRWIGPDVASDHFPLIVDFVIEQAPPENAPAKVTR